MPVLPELSPGCCHEHENDNDISGSVCHESQLNKKQALKMFLLETRLPWPALKLHLKNIPPQIQLVVGGPQKQRSEMQRLTSPEIQNKNFKTCRHFSPAGDITNA